MELGSTLGMLKEPELGIFRGRGELPIKNTTRVNYSIGVPFTETAIYFRGIAPWRERQLTAVSDSL